MAWMNVKDALPKDEKFHVCYTEVFGIYAICKFSTSRGWVDSENDAVRSITDWNETELDMPFPVRNKFDEEIGEKYGIVKTRDSSSSSSSSAALIAALLAARQ